MFQLQLKRKFFFMPAFVDYGCILFLFQVFQYLSVSLFLVLFLALASTYASFELLLIHGCMMEHFFNHVLLLVLLRSRERIHDLLDLVKRGVQLSRPQFFFSYLETFKFRG